jgi:multidrug efflux pump subunit AcrA (membrane-fusion protein)
MTYHGTVLEKRTAQKSTKGRIVRIALLLVLAGAGASAFFYRDVLATRLTKVLAVTEEDPVPTQRLERVSYQLKAPAIGEITGLESVPVSTPSTRGGGLKISWLIPEGSFINEGDPVIRYDSTDAQLNFERQQNTLQANQQRTKITAGKQDTDEKVLVIDRTDAEEEYEYAMTVLPQDETIFSKWDIIEAKINAGFAKERINFLQNKGKVQKRIARADQQILAIERSRAQVELNIARQTLDSLEVRSPASGLVLYRRERMREPQLGDESWPGQVILEIVDLAALQARVYVLERDAGSLEKGRPVLVYLDSIPEKVYSGIVRSVAALAQPLERNSPLKYFICEVNITDAGDDIKRIKPGMALKADVVLEKYDSCFVVPASAVTVKGEQATVYVQQGEEFKPLTVELGAASHGQSTILKGVDPGMTIAMRNPFETRKAHLPDFSKAGAGRQMRGGPGGPGMMIRIGR